MDSVNKTQESVNTELLNLLRDTYYEGFTRGNRIHYTLDIAARNQSWLDSHTLRKAKELSLWQICTLDFSDQRPDVDRTVVQSDPPHHRLDPRARNWDQVNGM